MAEEKKQNVLTRGVFTRSPNLLKATATVPFTTYPGTQIAIAKGSSNKIKKVGLPSITRINFLPNMSITADGKNAPMNFASKLVYVFDRSFNSGAKVYENTDYSMCLMSPIGIIHLLSEGRRALAAVQTYDTTNRALGEQITKALGFDYDDIAGDTMKFAGVIDQLTIAFNAFKYPKNVGLYERAGYLTSMIFKDSSDVKASMYAFVPAGYYKWVNKVGSEQYKSALELVERPTLFTIDGYRSFVNQLLDSILSNEDVLTMFGDTKKAFGEENLLQAKLIADPKAKLNLIYDHDTLTAIHNSNMVGNPFDSALLSTWNVTQDGQELVFKPAIGPVPQSMVASETEMAEAISMSNQLLDVNWANPTPEDIMAATRLKCTFKFSEGEMIISSAGSEIVTSYDVYVWKHTNNNYNRVNYMNGSIGNVYFQNGPEDLVTKWHDMLVVRSNFAFFPLIYINVWDVTTEELIITNTPLGELDNYVLISPDTLASINEVAMLSLWDVQSLLVKK